LASRELKQIETFLKQRRIHFVSKMRVRSVDGSVIVFVSSNVVQSKAGKGTTSRRQMGYLRKIAKNKLKIDLIFNIYSDEQNENVETGLRAVLARRLPNIGVEECFVSFEESGFVNIWLDVEGINKPLNFLDYDEIRKIAKEYTQVVGVQLGEIYLPPPPKVQPNMIVILRSVKVLAPAGSEQIATHLESQGFSVISEKWLKSQLDILRKKEWLIYQNNGTYLLTEKGLTMVPSGTSRSSSDIERALVLSRKLW
jgi:hypothetical protein